MLKLTRRNCMKRVIKFYDVSEYEYKSNSFSKDLPIKEEFSNVNISIEDYYSNINNVILQPIASKHGHFSYIAGKHRERSEDGKSRLVVDYRYVILISDECTRSRSEAERLAQKRYAAKKDVQRKQNEYAKRACKQYTLKFNKENDAAVIETLESKDNKIGYIRSLILKDINK